MVTSRIKRTYSPFFLTAALFLLFVVQGPSVLFAGTQDNEGPKWKGVVASRPVSGVVGEWTIGGRTFTADNTTQVEQEHGVLQVNSCAEVEYQVNNTGYRAVKIESKEVDECGNGGGDEGNERYGRIDRMPVSGVVGDWVIAGVTYGADNNTYFEQEHGGFQVGACVQVKFTAGTPPLVTKLETEQAYKCNGDSSNPSVPTGELYGVVESLPANLLGNWTIGAMPFVTDNTTQFEQEHGALGIGVLVEVKFYTDSSGVNHATKIESKYATDNDGHDDDGNGSYEGNEGHAYGKIEAMPTSGRIGVWTIAGINYVTDNTTRFEEEDSTFAISQTVKVQFYLDLSSHRVARKLETTNDTGGSTHPEHYKLYGFVQQMPVGTFNGQWLINGVTFLADNQSAFAENHGLLAVGAYVEIEYAQSATGTMVTRLETQVPPGAGTNNHAGTIEANPSFVARSPQQPSTTWVIGGRQFLVTAATDLNDMQGGLTVGDTVVVNSYTDANAQEVATQIRGIIFTQRLFLPFVVH